ncbi:hypothetical protein CgunFtcFv8_022493 [Champsocephalus gunnari]|uniref:Uncharacterized protein n=1 Tax=Champsocephalus gunnari TaxID=52237 RepID=A0AAN8HSQ2_CHAGU|nr:hypothetical protein CgunFtcFv8_022493 [Champsocephalus gunnari]
MLLIDNFPVTFKGRRSTKRRLEREDCEDSPRKKDPLAKTDAEEILVSSEEEDREKHPFISSAMAASQWCSAKKMGDKVILPQIISHWTEKQLSITLPQSRASESLTPLV